MVYILTNGIYSIHGINSIHSIYGNIFRVYNGTLRANKKLCIAIIYNLIK